jgi:hypothetical protein
VGPLPEIRSHLYCRMCLAVLQARESVATKSRGDDYDRYDQDHPALVPPPVRKSPKRKAKPKNKKPATKKDGRPTAWDKILNPVLQA